MTASIYMCIQNSIMMRYIQFLYHMYFHKKVILSWSVLCIINYYVYIFRNCPKAIWISISLVTVVYTFANVAYFTTVSREEVLSGAAVAVVCGCFSLLDKVNILLNLLDVKTGIF